MITCSYQYVPADCFDSTILHPNPLQQTISWVNSMFLLTVLTAQFYTPTLSSWWSLVVTCRFLSTVRWLNFTPLFPSSRPSHKLVKGSCWLFDSKILHPPPLPPTDSLVITSWHTFPPLIPSSRHSHELAICCLLFVAKHALCSNNFSFADANTGGKFVANKIHFAVTKQPLIFAAAQLKANFQVQKWDRVSYPQLCSSAAANICSHKNSS